MVVTPEAPRPATQGSQVAMAQRHTLDRRYEWQIARDVGEADLSFRCTGTDSTATLGEVFTMWAKHAGELATWDEAQRFGDIVAQYSTLRTEEIAVRLGLAPDKLGASVARHGLSAYGCDLTWHFEGPHGNRMLLERTIDD